MNGAMKAISVLTVVVLSVSIFALMSDGSDGYKESTVAVIGDVEYTSVSAAVNAAQEGDTITLVASVTESITISSGMKIVLDLNGYDITNAAGSHTITVQSGGQLTINGSGTVDNVSHQRACIYNLQGGTVVLNGGDYTRSKEAGTYDPYSGNGNSYYNIDNYGTITINEDVRVMQTGGYSSLIHNGWKDGSKNTAEAVAFMTINNGFFSGGCNTVKNDNWGVLVINGGTITNVEQAAVMNWNVCTINGGSFNIKDGAVAVVLNAKSSYGYTAGKLSIVGGDFDGKVILKQTQSGAQSKGTVTVSGGTFSSKLDEGLYSLEDGYAIKQIGEKWYVDKSADSSGGSVVTEESSVITTIETSEASITTANASFKISGSSTIGNIMVSAEPKTYREAPEAVASYEVTITASISYTVDITVSASIPNGYKALVYYIDDNGELVPVKVVSYTSKTVTFRTTHTTPFVVMTAVNPVIYDDDDSYPTVPATPASASSNNDDSDKTIVVACAAAAAAAVLAAMFFLVDSRRP